jgi:hypothetical protein
MEYTGLFQTSHLELLHGFVECLEVDDPEQAVERTIQLPEEEGTEFICCD